MVESAIAKARLGRLTTADCVVDTPICSRIGTRGRVNALDPWRLHEMGTQIFLGSRELWQLVRTPFRKSPANGTGHREALWNSDGWATAD